MRQNKINLNTAILAIDQRSLTDCLEVLVSLKIGEKIRASILGSRLKIQFNLLWLNRKSNPFSRMVSYTIIGLYLAKLLKLE
jgi:hypothetical protein